MSLITNWGYTLHGEDSLDALLTVDEFNVMTANKYASDARIESAIKAASNAVRNYCGWHLAPSLTCIFTEHLLYGNGRVKRVGNDLLVQLPSTYVESVQVVAFGGEELTNYAMEANGLLHIFNAPLAGATRASAVTVTYTAGLPDGLMDGVKEVVKERAVHGLAATAGVSSETAGGVSINYSSAWVTGGGSGVLSSMDAETLNPYKLTEVF